MGGIACGGRNSARSPATEARTPRRQCSTRGAFQNAVPPHRPLPVAVQLTDLVVAWHICTWLISCFPLSTVSSIVWVGYKVPWPLADVTVQHACPKPVPLPIPASDLTFAVQAAISHVLSSHDSIHSPGDKQQKGTIGRRLAHETASRPFNA